MASASSSGKYPSTPHLPFSPEVKDDDIQLSSASAFVGPEVVVTEKLDGGNCCVVDGKVYARTHAHEATHSSFSAIKELAQEFLYSGVVPEGTKLYGENMLGIHSIMYDGLDSFFYLFAVQQPDGTFAAWDDVAAMAEALGIPTAPLVFRGQLSSLAQLEALMVQQAALPSRVSSQPPEEVASLAKESTASVPSDSSVPTPEGFVVRVAAAFGADEFGSSMAKFVRAGHVQTDARWRDTWKKASLHAHTKRVKESK